jgi:integrase
MGTLTTSTLRRDELRKDTPLVAAIPSFFTSNYKLAQKSKDFYEGNFRPFINYLRDDLGREPVISDLDADNVEPYLALLLSTPTKKYPKGSPFRTRAAAVSLKRLSNWFAKDGLLTSKDGKSLLRDVQKPAEPEGVRQALSDDEVDAIFTAAGQSGARDYCLVFFAIGTGLRLNELRELRIADLNFTDNTVTVRADTSKFKRPRVVTFHPEVAKELDHFLRKRVVIRDEDPLFATDQNEFFTIDGFPKIFARLARASGVRRFCAHLCRHTWATRFQGNLLKLKRQGGWKKMEMLGRYDHADEIEDAITETTNPLARKPRVAGRYAKMNASSITRIKRVG